jgi:predicted P-loop ATPase
VRARIRDTWVLEPSLTTVKEAIAAECLEHCYHPILDYLAGLRWDGQPRLQTWFSRYLGTEDTPLNRYIGGLALVAAVRRVRQPGCKFDEMMVWENPEQGTNKSQALQILAVKPEWFSDNLPLGLAARETIEALSGHWLIEVSELQGMRKSDIEKVKAFLSRDTDRARTAYARTVTEARRQCVIIGTTNSEKYLRDLTGNRRIWPVRIGRFDLEALERDRDQLWAEAAAREASGASIRLPQELWPAAAAEQEQRLVDNPFVSVLDSILREKGDMVNGEWVDGKPLEGKITNEDVWRALGIQPAQRSQQHDDNMGAAMRALGWERKKVRAKGHGWGYVRGEPPYRRIEVTPGIFGSLAVAKYEGEGKV